MDFIHSLLIMEDDLDEDAPASNTPEQTSIEEEPEVEPEPGPSRSADSLLPWCKCGFCQVMPQEIENKCCGQRWCVTRHSRFQKLCLDPDVL